MNIEEVNSFIISIRKPFYKIWWFKITRRIFGKKYEIMISGEIHYIWYLRKDLPNTKSFEHYLQNNDVIFKYELLNSDYIKVDVSDTEREPILGGGLIKTMIWTKGDDK